eukprot:6439892-Lingulodinium_polyedra.AAC.1
MTPSIVSTKAFSSHESVFHAWKHLTAGPKGHGRALEPLEAHRKPITKLKAHIANAIVTARAFQRHARPETHAHAASLDLCCAHASNPATQVSFSPRCCG